MTVFYVAGPITGLPDLNRPAFDAACEQLRRRGHGALNPAVVVLLPGWTGSAGARLEYYIAGRVGLPRVELDDALRQLDECGPGGSPWEL